MNFSGRTPSLEMVRKCFMVSPQERHTMVGPLSGTKGDRLMVKGGVVRHVRLHGSRRERYRTSSHQRLARGRCR